MNEKCQPLHFAPHLKIKPQSVSNNLFYQYQYKQKHNEVEFCSVLGGKLEKAHRNTRFHSQARNLTRLSEQGLLS